jgi:hypothetical protein
MTIALAILRYAWPFVLAGVVWGVQEARLVSCRLSLDASHKRETALQSQVDVTRQRATDLALLYAGMLPQIDKAREEQEAKDRAVIAQLQTRVDSLSHVPDLRFSPAAVRLWDDASAAANGDAGATPAPAEGTASVPEAAGAIYSEADVLAFVTSASEAYRDAVQQFHECRDTYNAARSAQLKVSQ